MKIFDVLTITEASNLWNREVSTLRRNFANGTQFKIDVDVRKSGSTWLVTKEAMERVYGINKDDFCKDIKLKLTELSMDFNDIEFEWDGGESDGHFYIEDNSNLSDADFNIVRDKLDNISNEINQAYKNNFINSIEEIW